MSQANVNQPVVGAGPSRDEHAATAATRTFTWALVGRSDWVEGLNGVYFPSPSQTGSALEDVLHVLSDSLAAHRAELEEVSRAS